MEKISAKSSQIKKKRETLMDKIKEIQEVLNESVSGINIYGQSANVTLEPIGEDDEFYGHLFYSDKKLYVAFRSTEDDFNDSMDNIPEALQSMQTKTLNEISADWLYKLSNEKVLLSLFKSIENKLDSINDQIDSSMQSINKILDYQSNEIKEDVLKSLDELNVQSLSKEWIKARSLITIDPADSITRSSSYLESICKTILVGLKKSLPKTLDITNLIKECVNVLKLSEEKTVENDLLKLISGIKSIFQSVGSLRTHFGTAHGSSPGTYEINEHYARIANNAAGTVSIFLIQRYKTKSTT